MSQMYASYPGKKAAEQPAPGDGQEWLSCEVCSLTFKNQQHYSIHCGGTFHANRVAASLRTQQTATAGSGLEDAQAYGSSSNPSYWTGMQQAFPFTGSLQHDSQKTVNRSQSGQGQLNTSAEAYQSQLEYVSYPVGKQAKQSSDTKTAGRYEGMYGMPGFGWSDAQQDSSKSAYQSQQYPAAAHLPESQQAKGSSASKAAPHDAWKNYQPQSEISGAQTESKKSLDYGYSTRDSSAAPYASQQSDVPSWLKIVEPAVSGGQKTESYKSSNKATLYGSHDPFSSNASTRGTEHEDPWKSASNYETDIRGQIRRAKEESYGKAEQTARSKTRWDTGESYSRDSPGQGKQRGGHDSNRRSAESRRREERDLRTRDSYRDGREGSNSRNSEDSYRKRDSSRWEDASERDSHRKRELDARDSSELQGDSYGTETMSYSTKRTVGKREIGGPAEVSKSRENSSRWESSYTGELIPAGYTGHRDVSFSDKAGRNKDTELRDQGFSNKAAGKQETQQFGLPEWNSESWDTYGHGWEAKAPDASSHTGKSLQGAEAFGQKTSYVQQRQTAWGGETVQGKNDASWMQAESGNVWDAAYVSPAASGNVSWPGYTSAGFPAKDGLNEKMSMQGHADKSTWSQKENEKNSSVQHQSGNTWPIAKSGHGDMRHNAGTSGKQAWPNVDDVLAKFKHASKEPGQKHVSDVGSSAYGSLSQELSSYTTRPVQVGKTGKSTVDSKSGFDWNQTCGAKDKQQEFGPSYKQQEFAAPSDPYRQGVSDWIGSYSDPSGGFSPPGLGNRNKAGQKPAQANQWGGWSNEEQRADIKGGGVLAKDQMAGQAGSLGRGQPPRFQETKSLARGAGFGRGEVKGVEKPVGLSRSVQQGDRAASQDWARPFNRGQSLLGESPSVSSSSENASWFQAPEVSGAAGTGRGAGRGAAGNKPPPRPGEIAGWRHGFQDQSQLPAGVVRGGPTRGSESTLGQKNSWGFSGPGVKPTASQTKVFEKGIENKAPSNLHEKLQQFSERDFTRDWNEKGKDSLESRNSVRTSVAAPGQRANQSASFPASGQRTNQSSASVPSLLNLNVTPSVRLQKSDGPEDKYSKDAANDKQKSSGIMQQQLSSAFSGKKHEQSLGSMRTSGSVPMPPVSSYSAQESVAPSTGKSFSSNLSKSQSQPAAQLAAASVLPKQSLAPKQPLLPTPSMPPQGQKMQTLAVDAASKKPSGPAVKVSGGLGEFDPLDPASARKTGCTGDNKQKVTAMGSSSAVSSSLASVTATQTGISNAVISKEQTAANSTRSASKLDSKVTPAAAETKIGLKSSDPQLRGNGPSVTCSSSAAAAQPAVEARPAPLTSSTGNTARLDSSKKPVAQKAAPVALRSMKKEDLDNEDECDPALSEALGQFFSEGKDVSAETVKPANPVKKTAGNTKFVPTIRTYAVKSLAGFSKENQSSTKNDSSSETTKKLDANTTKVEPQKKPSPNAITIKVEKDDSISAGAGNDQKAEGKAGDPIAELAKLLPPILMKEITSGHPSKELLVKVADLLPADVLEQAVEYLQGSGALKQTAVTEKKDSEQEPQVPGAKVDDKAKADEEKFKTKAVETAEQVGKPAEALPGRVQVIQPRKGLLNPVASGSGDAKGPVTGTSAKTPADYAGNNKQPGTSVVKPPGQGSVVPCKRKYNDIDPTKLKHLSFDDMLQLFQELLQDVLGGLFEEGQKATAINEKRILDDLSTDDRELVLKVRQMTGITDLSKIVHTMDILKSLNTETIQALGQLDKSVIASSLTGNEKAQKMGGTVLHQITDLMAKGTLTEKQVKGPQGPVGCGRGSVRPSQPGSSSGRGVQSLLTLNFTETPKLGVIAAGVASATRALLPTPQQPRFPMEGMMPPRGMGLLPTPAGQANIPNFPRPFLRKRGPPPMDEFYGTGPLSKRWR